MSVEMKKFYTAPQLLVYGNVETITQNDVLTNADVPGGADGTANCPAGSTNPLCLS